MKGKINMQKVNFFTALFQGVFGLITIIFALKKGPVFFLFWVCKRLELKSHFISGFNAIFLSPPAVLNIQLCNEK